MKNLYFLIVIYFFLQLNVLAQNGWKLIHTFSEEIRCIAFVDSLNGFATAAPNSNIYKTTDDGITWQNLIIPGLNTSITKIIFVDDKFFIGVGGKGTIIKSTDGGSTWEVKNIGDNLDLRTIYAAKNGTLFACQWGGPKIYKSTDKGETWTTPTIQGFASFYYDMAFSNDNVGFAVGMPAVKTTDGGNTWFTISDLNFLGGLYSIEFINNNIGYVVGDWGIAKTTNGGNNWVQINNTRGESITTCGKNFAWVVGEYKILHTTNAGNSWNQQSYSPLDYLHKTICVDSLTCFAVGGSGTLYKTTNGGVSAPSLASPGNNSIDLPLTLKLSWSTLTDNNLFRIQVTTDTGSSNIYLDTTITGKTLQVAGLSLNTNYYWRAQEKFNYINSPWSYYSAFKTTKGAPELSFPANKSIDIPLTATFSWNDVTLSADAFRLQLSKDSSFNNIVYDNNEIGIDSVEVNQLSDSTFYYWHVRAKINNVYGEWSGIWSFRTLAKTPRLINPNNNSIVSPINLSLQWSKTTGTINYKILLSTDSLFQSNVIEKDELAGNSLTISLNYDTKYFWKVGANDINEQIHWSNYFSFITKLPPKTSFPLNIGNKWYYQAGSTRDEFYYGVVKEITDTLGNGFKEVTLKYYYQDSVHVSKEYWAYLDGKFYVNSKPEYNYYQVVYDDYLIKDSCITYTGICWHLVNYQIFNISDSAQEYSDFFSSHGYGSNKWILVFPEVGIVKTQVRNFTPLTIDSTYLIGMFRNGEVLGDTVLKTGVIVAENPLFLSNYCLYQNYPNPFNPITTINYQVVKSGFVTIKVYDILGKEVAILVNEEKPAGRYEVEFNGTKFSSGIYFYKLHAGNYSSVKKMILIK